MASLYTVDNGTVRLLLHPGQTRAWESERRFVFVLSGSQGGKTSFGPWWLWREIQTHGPGDYIAAAPTFDLFKLKILPEMRRVFEYTLGLARYWPGDKILELRDPATGQFRAKRADDEMWARVILRSAAAEGGLESATAKAAWLDEVGMDEFGLGAWEAVLRRLSLHRGRVLGTTTLYNLGWLKQQIYDPWTRGAPDIDVVQFTSVVNPAFPRAEFEARRAALPAWKFAMMYEGSYARPAGLIYADFIDRYRDEGGHKVRPFALPAQWPRVQGVDPGAVHTAKVWLAHDTGADVWYLYREQLDGNKSTREHVEGALALEAEGNERVIGRYIGNKGESQQRLDWQSYGAHPVFEPPVADVEAGIDKVIELLKQHRLYVFDTCAGVLDELGTYSRELDEAGEATAKIRHKERFHRLDALRYGVLGATYGQVPRWETIIA